MLFFTHYNLFQLKSFRIYHLRRKLALNNQGHFKALKTLLIALKSLITCFVINTKHLLLFTKFKISEVFCDFAYPDNCPKEQSQVDTISNGHDPQWTIPNEHYLKWIRFRMDTIHEWTQYLNGHDFERTRSRIDTIMNGMYNFFLF